MRKPLLAISLLSVISITLVNAETAQKPSEEFWQNLQAHCGKAYAGKLADGQDRPEFAGQKLVMHVKKCSDNEIKIPFVVGEDLSRTWILTKDEQGLIQLKHDHRNKDGSEDDVTQYGGKSTNVGHNNFQFFPADPATATLIPEASSNVWWIELNDKEYTYNLKRLTSNREPFRIEFDLTTEVEAPADPWG